MDAHVVLVGYIWMGYAYARTHVIGMGLREWMMNNFETVFLLFFLLSSFFFLLVFMGQELERER